MPTPHDVTAQRSTDASPLSQACPPPTTRTDDSRGRHAMSRNGRATPSNRSVEEDDVMEITIPDSVSVSKDSSPQRSPQRRKEESRVREAVAGVAELNRSKSQADVTQRVPLSMSPLPAIRSHPTTSRSEYEFSTIRIPPPSSSSYLRPSSLFRGTQQSELQTYNVEVSLKHVDLAASFLCGYLRIEGLTEDHPTLTTYFEGEIVGAKYSFLTKHESWGATQQSDIEHWREFPRFRAIEGRVRKCGWRLGSGAGGGGGGGGAGEGGSGGGGGGGGEKRGWGAGDGCVWMRWKECFLVPDHRVREITGASFEGFYYICFSVATGAVEGIYFHAKSEKLQKLKLAHVNTRGCYPSIEFR